MGGLIMAGFEGPFPWAHHEWEGPFLAAWRQWSPSSDNSPYLPTLEAGGTGTSAQPRELLWQLKSTSPFHNHDSEPLNQNPRGVSVEEYLEYNIHGATPDQWRELAEQFLANMTALGH